MDESELATKSYLLASIQKALLNEVTSDLRGVTAHLGADGVRCRFLFDAEMTEETLERIAVLESEISADYSGLTPVVCVCEYVPIQEQRLLLDGELWAFLRREER